MFVSPRTKVTPTSNFFGINEVIHLLKNRNEVISKKRHRRIRWFPRVWEEDQQLLVANAKKLQRWRIISVCQHLARVCSWRNGTILGPGADYSSKSTPAIFTKEWDGDYCWITWFARVKCARAETVPVALRPLKNIVSRTRAGTTSRCSRESSKMQNMISTSQRSPSSSSDRRRTRQWGRWWKRRWKTPGFRQEWRAGFRRWQLWREHTCQRSEYTSWNRPTACKCHRPG